MTLRVGIWGCGSIADYLHAPAIHRSGRCVLAAAIDPVHSQASNLAKKYSGVKSCSTLHEALGKIDAVVLAAPPHLRVTMLRDATQAGLHVFCEKPLANSVFECDQIDRIAEHSTKVVAVCHQFRYWPNRKYVEDLLKSENSWPTRVCISQGAPYSWKSVSGYTVRRDLVPGGVLINAGTHPLDTLISWFGDPLEFSYHDDACGGLESNVRMQMRFANDVTGEFRLTRTCYSENEIRLEWANRTIQMSTNDPVKYVLIDGSEQQVKLAAANVESYLDPAVAMYEEFAKACNGDDGRIVNVAEGTRVIRWVEAAYRQKRERALPATAPIPGLVW